MKSKVTDKDLGFKAMLEAAKQLADGAYAKVGILGGSADAGGLHEPGGDLTVGEIAVVQEFGTEDGRNPARSFVRSTYDRMREELQRDAFKLVAQIVIDRKITVEKALNILGLKLASGIRGTITDGPGVPPPNAPSTLRRKEAAGNWNKKGKAAAMGPRTLVDTATMLNALAWAVVLGTVEKAQRLLARNGSRP